MHGQNPEGSGVLPGQQPGQPRAEPCGRLQIWKLAGVGEGQTDRHVLLALLLQEAGGLAAW